MKNTFFKLLGALALVHGMGSCGALAQINKNIITADIVEGIDTEYDFLKGAGEFERGNSGSTPKGWSSYADAAGTAPVDGTGGSATATCTIVNSGIDGKSLRITHTAASNQGNGCGIPFSIPGSDTTKVLAIEFESRVGSGTFVAGSLTDRTSAGDSDVTIWIYDVTNAVVIQPSTHRIYSNSTTQSDRFIANFQAAYNSTSYRLIYHIGTANTSAFTLDIDRLKIKRSKIPQGSPITDWQSYTATFSAGFGSVVTQNMMWRRTGPDIHGKGYFVSAGSGASIASMSVPFAVDTTKSVLANNTASSGPCVGTYVGFSAANARGKACLITATTTSTTTLYFGSNPNAVNAALAQNVSSVLSNGEGVYIEYSYSVAGWGATTAMSDAADQRNVIFVGNNSSNTTAGSGTSPTFTTIKDSHGAWSGSVFTVPVPGDYKVTANLWITAGSDSLYVYKNGSLFRTLYAIDTAARSGSTVVPNCVVGDTITFRSASGITIQGASSNSVSIEKLGGGNGSISATELIAARYTSTAAQSITSSLAIVDYATKDYDTHGVVTTGASWKFTAPSAGYYEVTAGIVNSFSTSSIILAIYKNGSQHTQNRVQGTGSLTAGVRVSDVVKMNAGDYVDIRASNGSTQSNTNVAAENFVSIKRVGIQ